MKLYTGKENSRTMWFVLKARTSDDGDELLLLHFSDLIKYAGSFAWGKDIYGAFSTYKEAKRLYEEKL